MIYTPKPPANFSFNTARNTFNENSSGKLTTLGYMTIKNIISGWVKCTINGTQTILHPGDTLIMNPYDEGTFEATVECPHYSFVIDQPKFFDELCIPALTNFENFIIGDSFISDLCVKLNYEYEHKESFFENMLNSLTSALLIHAYRHYNAKQQNTPAAMLLGKHKIARLAINYIYKNCQNGVTTSDIGKHINVSTSYLCRCFKEATGVTPIEYAERIRCRKAKEDLSLGIYSVTQVAEKYHFNSLSYFNRRYKKYCGENPAKTLSQAKKSRSV